MQTQHYILNTVYCILYQVFVLYNINLKVAFRCKNPERYTLVRMVIGGWERIRVLMTFQLNYLTTFRSKYFATYAFWKLTGQNMIKNVYIRILFPISVIARSG
jgi:hypothetical protein